MKPLEKGGGLVDKREQLIFEAYKNRAVPTSKYLKRRIKKEYGFEPSSNLYTALINYQIKKFGKKLETGRYVAYLKKEELESRASQVRRLRYQRKQGRKSDEI